MVKIICTLIAIAWVAGWVIIIKEWNKVPTINDED